MPYADIAAFAFLLLSGGLALAHSDQWPSGKAWANGDPLLLAQLLAFVLLGLTQLAILISGRRARRNEDLEEACQFGRGVQLSAGR
jgi:cytochrome c biogenesis factor